ncbi:hypothetical protein BDN70DRAFT_795624 [Pholiota conissans]|uniref:BTB domain-containing protein n=1 Tax=Pholiota conissans TaxID=109636 RepID=A0A9P5ZGI3_9AGAR|nr:hypothetical protein BDN70DRAFT_795624 [Pholiota conissans]
MAGTTSSISSRISVRHGISEESLVLLSANPPETRFTDLAYSAPGGSTADSSCGGATLVDTQTGVKVERHPDLWFDDGSVICRAENTLFCVHMSQLARHSLVFHDMVMLSHPEATRVESTMFVQGGKTTGSRKVPVVYLYDSAEDVGNLLTALYDGPTFGNNDEDDFRVVSGILRLSTKYLVDSLRAKALAHLSEAWPSDLRTWDAREDLARSFEIEGIPKRYPHPFNVINLAREVNAPSLLPAAFYDLSRYSIAQIFEPTEDEPLYRSPPAPPLPLHDVQRLILGKEASQHTITTLIQSMGNGQYIRHAQTNALGALSHSSHTRKNSANGVCVSAAACRKDFTELVDLATQHYLFDRERGCYDPLYVAEELGQLKSAEFSECKACAKSLEAWAAREREKIWKMIPLWFRLESGGEISPNAGALVGFR